MHKAFFSRCFAALFFTFLSLISCAAFAITNLKHDSFNVFYGDVNEDGYDDIYFRAKEKFLLITGDVIVPIPYRDSKSFYISGADGKLYGVDDSLDVSSYQSVESDVLLGDFNGDGLTDYLMKSKDASIDSAIVYGGVAEQPTDSFIFSALQGYDIYAETPTVKDVNGDGKDDIEISFSNFQSLVSYANESGQFDRGTSSFAKRLPTTTPGVYHIGDDGMANYNIPVSLPVGGANMAPELSFQYSANAGNGHMGVGWSIGSASVISRCGMTLRQDGYVKSASLSKQGAFCLDGERLVERNGYWYKENYDGNRISKVGDLANDEGPLYFKIEYKSGHIAYLGNYLDSPNAYHDATGSYFLSQIQDRAGNKRQHFYDEDIETGEHTLSEISYPGGNVRFIYSEDRADQFELWSFGRKARLTKRLSRVETKVGSQVYRSYDLSYSARSTLSRLQQLRECAGNTCLSPIRFEWSDYDQDIYRNDYALEPIGSGYEVDPKYESAHLDLNGDGLNDLVYVYQSRYINIRLNEGNGKLSSTITLPLPDQYSRLGGSWNIRDLVQIDVDGDGKKELLAPFVDHYLETDGYDYREYDLSVWWMLVHDETGFSWVRPGNVSNRDIRTYYSTNVAAGRVADEHLAFVRSFVFPMFSDGTVGWMKALDLNGDGLEDIFNLTRTGGLFGAAFSTASSNPIDSTSILTPVPMTDKNGVPVTFKMHGKSLVIDIDNDGKQEILSNNGSTLVITGYENGGFYQKESSLSSKDFNYTFLADLNGDGLHDLVFRKEGKVAFALNQGGDFGPELVTEQAFVKSPTVLDSNGDGLSDILFIERDGDRNPDDDEGKPWRFLQSTGDLDCLSSGINCFVEQNSEITSRAYKGMYRVVDINGDGLQDILSAVHGRWNYFLHSTATETGFPNYLTKVSHLNVFDRGDEYAQETIFEYKPLYDRADNADFYLKDSQVIDGQIIDSQADRYLNSVSGPMRAISRVVERKTVNNVLVGEDKETSYQYEQLLSHLELGSIGFSKITSISPLTKKVMTYHRDWRQQMHGLLASEMIFKRAYASEDSEWKQQMIVNHQYQGVYDGFVPKQGSDLSYVYLKSSTRVEKAINGTTISTSVTTNTPDVEKDGFDISQDFGELALIEITTSSDSELHHTYTVTDFEPPDLNKWIVGKPKRSTITTTSTVDGETSSKTRATAWTYYFDTGNGGVEGYVKTKTVEPDQADVAMTTSYTYNARGLKEAVTVSGNNVQPRTTSTEYDTYGRYPVRVSNAIGSSTIHYHPLLGLKTSETDMNGLSSYWVYDELGHVLQSIRPDGHVITTELLEASASDPRSSYHYFDKAGESLSRQEALFPALYSIRTTDQNQLWTQTFYDMKGKAFEKRSLNAFGQVVVNRTEYEGSGQVYRQSEPYFLGAGDRYWVTTKERDAFQRPLRIKNQNGLESSIAYEGLTTRFTNEKHQTKTEVRNIAGKLREVKDAFNNSVVYRYDSEGNVVEIEDIKGNNVTSIDYDEMGRKKVMNDPDKGTWSYTYNVFGELLTQTDAKGQVTCQAYDSMGRMILRIDEYQGQDAANDCAGDESNPQRARWIYDTAANGLGKLHRVEGKDGYVEEYEYDSLGRQVAVSNTINNESFMSLTDYDNQSRPLISMYPSGLALQNVYNSLGALTEIKNAESGTSYWKLKSVDHRGKPTLVSMADGVLDTQTKYTDERGFVEEIKTSYSTLVDPLQHAYYEYDELANITLRRDLLTASEERAFYDGLNRLEHLDRKVSGGSVTRDSMVYAYDGNIQAKWGVNGVYSYGGTCNGVKAGPHAVTAANDHAYCYDANGDMLSGADRTITWASFGKPIRIEREVSNGDDVVVDFIYGPDRKRIQRIDTQGSKTAETSYVGSYEKVVTFTNNTVNKINERHSVGGFLVINKITEDSTVTFKENYLLKDNLGSVVATLDINELVNGQGANAVEYSSFDAWGKRRQADWSDFSNLQSLYDFKSEVNDRGFTGHEQIDEVGLIHMNGRLYDPVIGRFISADPIVQDPTDLQSLNRYAYVRNNPLSLVDPSGFSWLSREWRRTKKNWPKLRDGLKGMMVGGIIGFSYGYNYRSARQQGYSKNQSIRIGRDAATTTGIALGSSIAMCGAEPSCVATATITATVMSTPGAQSVVRSISKEFFNDLLGFEKGVSDALANMILSRSVRYGVTVGYDSLIVADNVELTEQQVNDARLAKGVYDLNYTGADAGYAKIGDHIVNSKTGFQAALFVDKTTGHHVLAFAGTTGFFDPDWIANIFQGMGFETSQYTQAISLAKSLFQSTNGDIHFVGHSLGGGLASAAAIWTGGSATVFNAAGLHPNTLAGVGSSSGSVTYFYSSLDALRLVNALTPVSVPGNHFSLGPAGAHGMGGVCSAMGC